MPRLLDADIRDYFRKHRSTRLMLLVERRISDRRVLKLLRQWLAEGRPPQPACRKEA